MKTRLFFSFFLIIPLLISCNKTGSLRGEQSPMGEVGVTITSASYGVDGVTDVSGEVIALEDGVSVYTGTATITNDNFKNILANFPGTEIEGDQVTMTDIEFTQTDQGLESVTGLAEGIIVDYDSKVGDEYKIPGGVRTVVSKSTEDDFFWGGMMIKVTQVEEYPKNIGVKKVLYSANHKFGLVAIQFTFDDNTTAMLPVYTSTQN